MDQPPFRPALLPSAVTWVGDSSLPLAHGFDDSGLADIPAEPAAPGRLRLGEMDSHLHCSVIGTCLSTAELRKLMARFIHVGDLSDLDVHHEAVRLASQNHDVSRALHKALDRRHDASVTRFGRARDAAALGELWQQALDSGEVPGAYWAVLTHRRTTADLRQRVFGDVHMLSHLVGAANRADIRRLVALERENAELRERTDRQQERLTELGEAREGERLARQAAEGRSAQLEAQLRAAAAQPDASHGEVQAETIALQTRRREEAENRSRALAADVDRLEGELARLREQAAAMARELAASEAELRSRSAGGDDSGATLTEALRDRRVLYVGGRPSSSAAIRDLVLRHGGEFQRHDGGIEDRKASLAPALAWASLVVFPVDCVDHDSALALKRSCLRQSVPFLALRSASVASFAAGIADWARPQPEPGCGCGLPCRRHG